MKRSFTPILLLVVFTLLTANPRAFPQDRYLISPDGEVMPILPGQSPARLIHNRLAENSARSDGVCTDVFYFGYPQSLYPMIYNFGTYHSDVIGQWYVAPATGRIDTIWWEQWTNVGAFDSMVYLRVHEPNIGPDYGPGVRPGPFNPPCQNWGYWNNTNDVDQGIAAFIEDATDSNWVSTINNSMIPSTPPLGDELWGYGGLPIAVHAGSLNWVAMDWYPDTLHVNTGDKFFISFRIPPCPGGPTACHDENFTETRTEWGAAGFIVSTTADQDYPSRLWKFYEHDKGPSNCAGAPIDSIRRGWVARGGFSDDTLDVAVLSIWYSMTITSNAPPVIEAPPRGPRTFFDTGPNFFDAVVWDCDPLDPLNSGVQSVTLQYEVNGVAQPDLPMNSPGADYWQVNYPPPTAPATVTYRIRAVDLAGAETVSPTRSFNVVAFGKRWYGIDTGISCVPTDISMTGTEIDTSEFFDLLSPGVVDKDDGLAGPIDLGGTMMLFNHPYRYAWVSVDGAIALTNSATDTAAMDQQFMEQHFLPDSAYSSGPAFNVAVISPLWSDYIAGDTGAQYGSVRYGDNGDSCLFIVRWDSVSTKDNLGPSGWIRFGVVLNLCDGTVEFQYDDIGIAGSDSNAVSGMRNYLSYVSGSSGSVFLNRDGYPLSTRPRDNQCIRFSPRNRAPGEGWNLVSVSVLPDDEIYSASRLFPGGSAYDYVINYTGVVDTVRPGSGYWMKNLEPEMDGSPGKFFNSISIPVRDRWNLIGGTSFIRSAGELIPNGGTSLSSNIVGYGSAGYHLAATLNPGEGYWVKVSGAGTLELPPSPAVPKALSGNMLHDIIGAIPLTIRDGPGRSQTLFVGGEVPENVDQGIFELPPVPPGGMFDARFADGTMLWSPDPTHKKSTAGQSVLLRGAVSPVVIRWDIPNGMVPAGVFTLEVFRSGSPSRYPMDNPGSVTILEPELSTIKILSGSVVTHPSEFTLSQNYPNPFNPFTRIDYTLPTNSRVRIMVFNVAGENVTTLVDEDKPAGAHSVRWDAGVMPSGVYYCRMTARSFSSVRKLLLIK